jgi:hypothetical protein
MPRQPRDGTCIFCGSRGLREREHVIADWLRDALAVTGSRKQRIMVGPDLTIVRRWQKPIATKRVRCVCHDCNHGWMKDLEDAVKPHLSVLARQGMAIVPAAPAARLLTAWAFKTVAVAQELESNELKPLDSAACDQLRCTSEPPPGVSAWMLPFSEPQVDGFVRLATYTVRPNEIGYVAWVVIGRVGLVLIGPWRGMELPPLQPSDVDGLAPVQLWPIAPRLIAVPRRAG